MKMKKAILLSLMTGLFAVPALTGCGGDGKIHIKFWHTMGQSNQDTLNRALKEFYEDYPQYKVDHAAQGDYAALLEKLNKAVPAGTMPHMAFCYPDHVADYMKSNAVVDINTYLNDPELAFTEEDGPVSDFVDIYWDEGQHFEKSGLYCVPFAKSTEVMFYNQDFFDKYSSLISVPTTWEEMWNTCKIIKEQIMDAGLEKGLEFPMGYDSDSNLFITLCQQQGIPYTTNENISTPSDHIKFNNPQAKALITDLVQKVHDGWFATKNILPNNAYTSTYFTEGKTVMSIGSTGGTSYNTSTNFRVGVAKAPITSTSGQGNKYIMQGPDICFFRKGSDEVKKGAWILYKYITRAIYTAAYSVKTGYEPVRESAYELPGYQDYLKGDTLQARVSAVTSTIEDKYYVTDVFYGSATARDKVGELLGAVASGEKTLDQAFADAYKKATDACGN